MSRTILKVDELGKTYFQYESELSRVLSWIGLHKKPTAEIHVLKNISFSVEPGEAIGIVGENGAGKSTLLKIVTGTQQPTTGRIEKQGRIGSILELGMGFNPDFTGRQNALHSAGLMGFSQAEIEDVIDDIEQFAEVGEYFDQPVNTYSSGMQMRVAFSVVTAFRPALLIVDEALSVGDTYFQHKSFSRIREFQEKGSALLLVSHDRSAIQSLCNRAILLDRGSIIKDGDPESVMDYYNALIADKENNTVRTKQLENGRTQTLSGTGEATVSDICITNEKNERTETINVGEQVCLNIIILANEDLPGLVVGYAIKDRLGQCVFGTNTHHLGEPLSHIAAHEQIKINFKFAAMLGPGTYSVAVAIHAGPSHMDKNYEWRDLALVFDVVNLSRAAFTGMTWIPPKMECFR